MPSKIVPVEIMKEKKNVAIIDVQYTGTTKDDNGKWISDYLYIIWRDMDTLEKYITMIESPTTQIWFAKEETRDYEDNKPWERKENLTPKVVPYKQIFKSIADDSGNNAKNLIKESREQRNNMMLRELYRYPYVYGADFDIRVFYRYLLSKNFKADHVKLTKGFLDIEVDLVNAVGRFPVPQVSAIELVTVVNYEKKKSYTFILRQPPFIKQDVTYGTDYDKKREEERYQDYLNKVKLQNDMLSHLDDFEKKCHEEFDEVYGVEMEYKFYVYSDEAKMLVHIFQMLELLDLDFVGIWNLSFDIPYIIDRAWVLGLNPNDLLTRKDLPNRSCRFVKDRRSDAYSIKNNGDYFLTTNSTLYVCLMRIYAQIRKGGPEERSNYKLNTIAAAEIGDSKINYEEVGNLRQFACNDYVTYTLYNIKDVLLLGRLEERTEDLDTLYSMAYGNLTPYSDVFKQTAVLRNLSYKYYDMQDIVPGCNTNALDYYDGKAREAEDFDDEEVEIDEATGKPIKKPKKKKEKKEGAVVGNPKLIIGKGIDIYGRPSTKVFRFNIDMDMTAFYPHVIISNNIEPTCLLFKMFIPPEIFTIRGGEQPWNGITDKYIAPAINGKVEKYYTKDIAKEVMDNYQTGNILSTGYKFLNMPDVAELYSELLLEM